LTVPFSFSAMQTLGIAFGLHPLSLEDITQFQRIKVDAYDNYLYIAMHIWQLERDHHHQSPLAQEHLAYAGHCSESSSDSSSSSDDSSNSSSSAAESEDEVERDAFGGVRGQSEGSVGHLAKPEKMGSGGWKQLGAMDIVDADLRYLSVSKRVVRLCFAVGHCC
jgi:hypothetical protein